MFIFESAKLRGFRGNVGYVGAWVAYVRGCVGCVGQLTLPRNPRNLADSIFSNTEYWPEHSFKYSEVATGGVL